MYGKEYLDHRDAEAARKRIREAIDEALRGVEDGHTRDCVRAEFNRAPSMQDRALNQLMAQQSAYPRPTGYGGNIFGQLFGVGLR